MEPEPKQSALQPKEVAQVNPIATGGVTKLYKSNWQNYTSDRFILQCIEGCKIDFTSSPVQSIPAREINFNTEEKMALNAMIDQLRKEHVIVKCNHENGEFINNVFLRKKRSSTNKYRMILNVKSLNTFVRYVHFKMDTLSSCLQLVESGCYMASIDLKNAYHSVPMDHEFTKFLKFFHNNDLYKYLVLPQGYRDSPRIFTKIMKPIIAHFHSKGILCSLYIDDFYIQGSSFSECKDNVTYVSEVVTSLGFNISDKSNTTPSQKMSHLGFMLNSVEMTVSLEPKKIDQILSLIVDIPSSITVRLLAKIIGILVATFPAVEYGPLYYRDLESLKIKSLHEFYDFDRIIQVSKDSYNELLWWINEGVYSKKPLCRDNPSVTIRTDASLDGFGAVKGSVVTQGIWTQEEKKDHINVLELKAVYLGLMSLCRDMSHCHIRVEVDNMTAVTYINNMGGTHSVKCNCITKKIILWCKQRNIWISAYHIPGVDNVTADRYSRKLSFHTEWMLDKNVFKKLCLEFGTPDIDLFASRSNHLLPSYMSLYPDPFACAINAFHHVWNGYVYIFPPFNLISRILQKILRDRTQKVLIIVPIWTTQNWYPKLRKMLLKPTHILKRSKKLLIHPSDSSAVHPLYPKFQLMACVLSGQH